MIIEYSFLEISLLNLSSDFLKRVNMLNRFQNVKYLCTILCLHCLNIEFGKNS